MAYFISQSNAKFKIEVCRSSNRHRNPCINTSTLNSITSWNLLLLFTFFENKTTNRFTVGKLQNVWSRCLYVVTRLSYYMYVQIEHAVGTRLNEIKLVFIWVNFIWLRNVFNIHFITRRTILRALEMHIGKINKELKQKFWRTWFATDQRTLRSWGYQ